MAKKRYQKWLIIVFLIAGLPFLLYLFLMPDLSRFKKENPQKTSFMEYREKEAKKKGKRFKIIQVWTPLHRISPYLIKAVLIAEDDKFWSHEGFDYEAIQNAIEKDIKTKKFKFGGSTISQQLARNLFLSPRKSLLRKLREALITWKMEKVLPKKRILELYLNVVEWGEGIFGIEAASRYYYGKPSCELNPMEAARLASVLPNPRRYHPTSDQRYVTNRSNIIYRIMIQRGIVIPEYEETLEEIETPLSIEGSKLEEGSP